MTGAGFSECHAEWNQIKNQCYARIKLSREKIENSNKEMVNHTHTHTQNVKEEECHGCQSENLKCKKLNDVAMVLLRYLINEQTDKVLFFSLFLFGKSMQLIKCSN